MPFNFRCTIKSNRAISFVTFYSSLYILALSLKSNFIWFDKNVNGNGWSVVVICPIERERERKKKGRFECPKRYRFMSWLRFNALFQLKGQLDWPAPLPGAHLFSSL